MQHDKINDTSILTQQYPFSLIFSGKDLHALRIYRDGPSRAVRLQVSVYQGEMK